METEAKGRLDILYGEIGALARFVENAMRAVSEVGRPLMESSAQIPTVASHLTDLVRMTEDGVMEVMRLTELIQDSRAAVMGECRAVVESLRESRHVTLVGRVERVIADLNEDERRLTEIMTALSFQDLVAQRVKKLVVILEDVREKLVKLVVEFGIQHNENGGTTEGKTKEILRQLEQSENSAMKQHAADEILTRFGFQ
ncbi:MAG: protein phosphatase CheZ [Nitrospira sp.]|nr:protein phosphatase CheZ [Nitrospira sp.]